MNRPRGARVKEEEDRSFPHFQSGTFQTEDGATLYYEVEGKGEPLVFCYGLVCSSLHWTYQIDYFRQNYQCIWMDYRGHQKSETPTDFSTISLPQFAKDLNTLLNHLQIKKATFLGHSMGVNVVLEFCRLFPKKVEKLVLISGIPTRPLEHLLHSNAFEPALKILSLLSELAPEFMKKAWSLQHGNKALHEAIGFLGFNRHLTPKEDIARYVDQLALLDPRVFTRLFKSYDEYDGSTWLHSITQPCLIIAGNQDLVIPYSQQELMHQLIPKSIFKTVSGGSHCPQMDLPETINAMIEDFLSTTHSTET